MFSHVHDFISVKSYFPKTTVSSVFAFFLQSSVDKMLQKGNASMLVGASSWRDQFFEAFTVQAGKAKAMNSTVTNFGGTFQFSFHCYVEFVKVYTVNPLTGK